MLKSDDKKIITFIGDVILRLLNDNTDISAGSVSAALRQMLDAETNASRRQLISQAPELTGLLFINTVYPEDGIVEKNQPGVTLPFQVTSSG